MTFPTPRLTIPRDLRVALANVAEMDATADAAELARREVVEQIKAAGMWAEFRGWKWDPVTRCYIVQLGNWAIVIDERGNCRWPVKCEAA